MSSEFRLSVSIIIPAFNCESYIAEAMESALHQSRPAMELIVVDDGSSDGTAEIAGRFGAPVRCLPQAHAGAGAARNRGVAVAKGTLIAFLDADDRWPLYKLERQIEALRPELDIIFGGVRQLRSGAEWEQGIADTSVASGELLTGLVPGTMLIRRQAFNRVGHFRTEWKVGEFIDWYARAIDLGLRSLCLPDLLLWRRIHTTNTGLLQSAARSDYAKVLKAALDRRRARVAHDG